MLRCFRWDMAFGHGIYGIEARENLSDNKTIDTHISRIQLLRISQTIVISVSYCCCCFCHFEPIDFHVTTTVRYTWAQTIIVHTPMIFWIHFIRLFFLVSPHLFVPTNDDRDNTLKYYTQYEKNSAFWLNKLPYHWYYWSRVDFFVFVSFDLLKFTNYHFTNLVANPVRVFLNTFVEIYVWLFFLSSQINPSLKVLRWISLCSLLHRK